MSAFLPSVTCSGQSRRTGDVGGGGVRRVKGLQTRLVTEINNLWASLRESLSFCTRSLWLDTLRHRNSTKNLGLEEIGVTFSSLKAS